MKCSNCQKHEATLNWIENGSVLDYTHGFFERWCECCVLKAQIKYAEKTIKSLKELKKKLKVIKCI